MKKSVMCLLAAAVAGCTGSPVKDQPVKSDMSGYATLEDDAHVFYDLSVKQMAEKQGSRWLLELIRPMVQNRMVCLLR